jgi:hypothetical protein
MSLQQEAPLKIRQPKLRKFFPSKLSQRRQQGYFFLNK